MGEQKCPSGRSLPWSEREVSGQLCPMQDSKARAGAGEFFDKLMEKPIGNVRLLPGQPFEMESWVNRWFVIGKAK